MTNKEIIATLNELSDPEYAEKLQNRLPETSRRAMGVPPARLTELSRELAPRHDWRAIVKRLPDDLYETTLLKAFIFLNAETDKTVIFEWLKEFLTKMDSTAMCDATCLACRVLRTWSDETLTFIENCLQSKNEMTVRFGIVMLLDYFTTSDFADTTLHLYNEVNASKSAETLDALAWGYSVCFMSFPKRTLEALQERTPREDTIALVLAMIKQPRMTEATQKILLELIKTD